MNAHDFGVVVDPARAAEEEVRPYRGLTPEQRYVKFLDLMSFLERIWKSIEPERRARYDRVQRRLDDPGHWWERVPFR